MDPVSQGALGAVAAQSGARRPQAKIAAGVGWLAGMAADLDVVIRSASDPLLFLEYHRGFTHSLLFIPFGGALTGLLLYLSLRTRSDMRLSAYIGFATLGYATHALLDACTTYGTQLLWPISDTRFAWNNMSIIDPLYTGIILLLLLIGTVRHQPAFARFALIWVLAYPMFGVLQRERAEAAGLVLAQSRGHAPLSLEAKPGFANLLLWKTIYEYNGKFYVDAVRVGTKIRTFDGESIARLDLNKDFPWLAQSSQQAKDVTRFSWFSRGYVAVDPAQHDRIIDIRYSFLPNQIGGLWSIELSESANADSHVRYATHRQMNNALQQYWRMLTAD